MACFKGTHYPTFLSLIPILLFPHFPSFFSFPIHCFCSLPVLTFPFSSSYLHVPFRLFLLIHSFSSFIFKVLSSPPFPPFLTSYSFPSHSPSPYTTCHSHSPSHSHHTTFLPLLVHYEMDRLFCSKCGANHMSRVGASVNAKTGELKLHLKANYVVNTLGE